MSGPVGAAVTFKLAPDKVEEFKKLYAEARKHVRANPGCTLWDLYKHRTEPDTYIFLEGFKDDESFKTHVANMKEWGPRLRPFMTDNKAAVGDGV